MVAKQISILWADDEIDLLRPYVLFLEQKGYRVLTATNGEDAIKSALEEDPDLIFLDENMPGKSGLQTLDELNQLVPLIPVIMITKNEEEDIMEQAIGSKIADYLIKPVNPNQILLAIKKNTENRRLVTEKTQSAYQSEFARLGMLINSASTYTDWVEIFKKLTFWELELGASGENMGEILSMQKTEANSEFSKFIKNNYEKWFSAGGESNRPLMSPDIVRHSVIPALDTGQKTMFIVIDNLRYDQWLTLSPIISEYCKIDSEELYLSILPTATQYARNAIFAGLMPIDIEKMYPNMWITDEEEELKNQYEEDFLRFQFARLRKNYRMYFEKVSNYKGGKKLVDNFTDLLNYDLSVIVYSFVDMLSHARTDMEMIRELANDEAAYRSLTQSWFQHSHLLEFIREASSRNIKLIITTDHGTVKVLDPIKVVGDRNTSSNLRYKMGKNLNYNPKEVFEVRQPARVKLPQSNVSSAFIFAMRNDFMVYPNNFNHFVNYYKNTFQHGGISLEEMIIPLISLSAR